MVLGYTDYCFVGLFRDEETAKSAGCTKMQPVEDDYVQDDGTVYAVKVTIGTYLDQDIEMIYVEETTEIAIADISYILLRDNLREAFNCFLDSLSKDEQKIILSPNGEIPLGEFISNINIDILQLEPDVID